MTKQEISQIHISNTQLCKLLRLMTKRNWEIMPCRNTPKIIDGHLRVSHSVAFCSVKETLYIQHTCYDDMELGEHLARTLDWGQGFLLSVEKENKERMFTCKLKDKLYNVTIPHTICKCLDAYFQHLESKCDDTKKLPESRTKSGD